MTPEEMAHRIVKNFFDVRFFEGAIEEAINQAIKKERESCAQIADDFNTKGIPDYDIKYKIAQAIRARGGR